jgi:hypothetical protein
MRRTVKKQTLGRAEKVSDHAERRDWFRKGLNSVACGREVERYMEQVLGAGDDLEDLPPPLSKSKTADSSDAPQQATMTEADSEAMDRADEAKESQVE